MKIIRYPGAMDKDEFYRTYGDRLIACLKTGMKSSYDIVITPENDSSWFRYFSINLAKGVRYIVLEEDDRIRGYLVWNIENEEVHIYDLVIHPDFHSDCATLRALLRNFAADLKGTGLSKLVAYTNFKNERMNRLLLRHGFVIQEKRTRGTVYTTDLQVLIEKFSR